MFLRQDGFRGSNPRGSVNHLPTTVTLREAIMLKCYRSELLALSFGTVFAIAISPNAFAQSKKLSYEQAWAQCKSEVDRTVPGDRPRQEALPAGLHAEVRISPQEKEMTGLGSRPPSMARLLSVLSLTDATHRLLIVGHFRQRPAAGWRRPGPPTIGHRVPSQRREH